jgi:hypothetical protein
MRYLRPLPNWWTKTIIAIEKRWRHAKPKPKPKPVPVPKPPTTPIAMFDDVNIDLIPKSAPAVAGYVGGRWPTFKTLAKAFPHAKLLSIAVTAAEDAMCLDVERGDATPAQAPAWVKRQHARGVRLPIVYTSASLPAGARERSRVARAQARPRLPDLVGALHVPSALLLAGVRVRDQGHGGRYSVDGSRVRSEPRPEPLPAEDLHMTTGWERRFADRSAARAARGAGGARAAAARQARDEGGARVAGHAPRNARGQGGEHRGARFAAGAGAARPDRRTSRDDVAERRLAQPNGRRDHRPVVLRAIAAPVVFHHYF